MSYAEHPIIEQIEKFCGQAAQPHEYTKTIAGHPYFPSAGIGHSQLNELLLSLHLDRTHKGFFEYVFGGVVKPDFEAFKKCITEFRIGAIRKYGNVNSPLSYFPK